VGHPPCNYSPSQVSEGKTTKKGQPSCLIACNPKSPPSPEPVRASAWPSHKDSPPKAPTSPSATAPIKPAPMGLSLLSKASAANAPPCATTWATYHKAGNSSPTPSRNSAQSTSSLTTLASSAAPTSGRPRKPTTTRSSTSISRAFSSSPRRSSDTAWLQDKAPTTNRAAKSLTSALSTKNFPFPISLPTAPARAASKCSPAISPSNSLRLVSPSIPSPPAQSKLPSTEIFSTIPPNLV